MGILDDAIREHLELKRRHGADSTEVSRQEREILGGDGEPLPPETAPAQNAVREPAFAPEPSLQAPASAEPLAGSPLTLSPPDGFTGRDDIFPGTGELLAAANETPAAPAPAPASPSLGAPAPADADSETAARSGARRLSDAELAAWRRRLSERADRLAAGRPATPPADAPATPAGGAAAAAPKSEPPAYWSGNSTSADAGTPPLPAPGSPAPAQPPAPGVPVDFFEAGDAEDAFAPEKAPEPDPAEADVLDQTPDFLEETPEHDRMWFEQRPPRDFDFG